MKCKIYLKKCFALLAVMMLSSAMAFAQNQTIGGKVTDVAGSPLIGVSVLVKGTNSGTVTDAAGAYSIRVSGPQAVLEFNYLGYVTQEFAVGAKKTIDVVMAEDAQQLDEVVVIGYGTVKKRDLTGSVASVSSEALQAMPINDVSQALQGRMAGVNITSNDGRPGSDVKIRVRGGGSITQSNNPLFIVDGFPVSSINDIPASQISSIDVLKDASSTAIYGARGANGVIIVTTKTPKGEKFSVSYNGFVQISQPIGKVDVLGAYDYTMTNWEYNALYGGASLSGFEKAMAIGGYKSGTTITGENYNNPGGINTYKTERSINWMDEITRQAFSHQHNVSINGGGAKNSYTVDYSYADFEGIRMNSGSKRSNVMAKIRQEIAKGLTLDLTARYSRMAFNGGASVASMTFTPVYPLGDYDENSNSGMGLNAGNLQWRNNPVDVINDYYELNVRSRLRANGSLAWEIIKGLTARTEFSLGTSWSDNRKWSGPINKDSQRLGKGGDATMERKTDQNYTWSNTVSYQVQGLSRAHSLNLLIGQELTGSDGDGVKLEGKDFPLSFDYKRAFAMMAQYNAATSAAPMSSSFSAPGRMASFFGRANYTLMDRYLFTATFRADGSSNFAPSNRWGYFPAAAVAWRLSEESFLKNFSKLDNLKLRLSYGTAGNDQIDPGLWKAEWVADAKGYTSQGVYNPLYKPASGMMPNPNLKWETTVTRNLGVDWGFFNGRLYGTVDVYWNNTKDLLLVDQLPAFTGYTEIMNNVGKTSNKGFEITVGGDIIRKKDFTLSANVNFSVNKNKIEALSNGFSEKTYSSGLGTSSAAPKDDFYLAVGQPLGQIRGYVFDGFYTTDDFNYNAATKAYTLKDGVANSFPQLSAMPGVSGVYPGMMKLKKMKTDNHATSINENDDCVIIGNTQPKNIGGFNVNATYKNFDLMMAFNWVYGNDVYNYTKANMMTGAKNPNRNFAAQAAGRYRLFDLDSGGNLVRVTDPTALSALNANATSYYPFHEFRVLTTEMIEDGSYLRLNNLTIGYTVPQKFTKKVAISKLRIYATGTNLFTWTNYSGIDPEVDNRSYGTYPVSGMDYNVYPRARTFTFGVNLTF